MRAAVAARKSSLRNFGRVRYFVPCKKRYYTASASTQSTVHDYDIVVVGGGPAGLAFANALVSHPPVRESLRIALIEAGDLNRVRHWSMPEHAFSNRVSSLTNASRQFIADTGAWGHVDETRVTRVEEMQVWDGVSDARIRFNAGEVGITVGDGRTPYMSSMTENLNLQRALLRCLDSRGGVDLVDNTKVSSIEKDNSNGDWPIVHTSNGGALRARLLVGADGPNSPVRSYAGIDTYGWSYDTRAIVATIFHPPRLPGLQDPNTTAYQRFLPTGPIAFLPLSPTASSLVWSTKPSLAAVLTSIDPRALTYLINAAFRLPEISLRHLNRVLLEEGQTGVSPEAILEEIRWRERSHDIDRNSAYSSHSSETIGVPPSDAESVPPMVTSVQPGTAASFPLRMSHADTYIGENERGSRTVLLGDAAHTTHPLAGQGLNMGLGDAQALSDCIRSSVLVGGDIGSRTSLLPYTRERYFENHKLLSVADKLHKLYSSTLPPVVWARSVGLEIVNELDTLKMAIMLSAGSSSTTFNPQPGKQAVSPWSIAANGVELLGGIRDAARLVGGSLQDVMVTGLKSASKSMERR